jgi:hypothetical protein
MATLSQWEKRNINQIARRIGYWARRADPMSCGYCMSGSWHDFYQRFLFPNKTLRDDLLAALIQKLRDFGIFAELSVSPFKNGGGLYLYMKTRRLVA